MTVPRRAEAHPGGDDFPSLADVQAWLAALPEAIGSLSGTELAEAIPRVERAYERFPELAAQFPRRTLLRRLRAAAATLPDTAAVPLLLLCAAAEPADPACRTALFERAARAHGGALLLALVRLFRSYTAVGWEEIGPAVAALSAEGAGARTILEILSEILDDAGNRPEDAAGLGRVLAPLLASEPAAIEPAALARAAAGARRRLGEASAGAGEAPRRHALAALAERVKARLGPPAWPREDKARPARPGGETAFPSFVAQWPELAIEVPAAQLHADHAVLGADGVLRAGRHGAGAFCCGPRLNLPAGRYRIRIVGEAGAGAEYSMEILCRLGERATVPLCEGRYVRDGPIAGTLAELAFASDIALRDFQVVVRVRSPAAAFALASLAITADRLRPDPED
jgi:hypothetical protein